MGVYFIIALRNLVQARRRTLLVSIALAMVTTLLVMMLALSQGITDTMIRSATTLSTGHVNIAGWFKAKQSDGSPVVSDVTTIRKIAEENTPGVDYVIDRVRGWARIISETGSVQAGLFGIDVAEESRFFKALQLAEEKDYEEGGRAQVLGDPTRLAEPNTILIFAEHAKRMAVDVGDTVTVSIETMSGSRNTVDVTVVAVAKNVGFLSNWNVYLPKSTLRQLYQLKDDVSGAVQIYLKDSTQSEQVMGQLTEVLKQKGYKLMEHDPQAFWMKFETVQGEDWVGQKLDLTVWSDEVSFLQWALIALNGVSGMLISILVVIIAIGIMNSMWISVRERVGEVGTLRAIGMHRGRVLVMFLLESVLLGIFGTGVGAVLGAVLALLLDSAHIHVPIEAMQAILMSDTLHMSVRPGQLVTAIIAFTFVTAVSAFLPAWRASRMQPVTAIQTVI